MPKQKPESVTLESLDRLPQVTLEVLQANRIHTVSQLKRVSKKRLIVIFSDVDGVFFPDVIAHDLKTMSLEPKTASPQQESPVHSSLAHVTSTEEETYPVEYKAPKKSARGNTKVDEKDISSLFQKRAELERELKTLMAKRKMTPQEKEIRDVAAQRIQMKIDSLEQEAQALVESFNRRV